MEERVWIGEQLRSLLHEIGGKNPQPRIINLGSGATGADDRPDVRTLALFEQGEAKLVNVDSRAGSGVDLVVDIASPLLWRDPDVQQSLVFLLTNVLEHVSAPEAYARSIAEQLPPGAFLIATVPFVYPHHPDPIDNRLRLSGDQLQDLFPGMVPLLSETIKGERLIQLVAKSKPVLLRTLLGFPISRSCRSRLLHLHRRVAVGCSVLQKSPC